MNIHRLDEDQQEDVWNNKRGKPILILLIIGASLSVIATTYMLIRGDVPFLLFVFIMMGLTWIPMWTLVLAYKIKDSWDYLTVQYERENEAKEKRFKALRKRREERAKLESEDVIIIWQARDKDGELYMYSNEPTLEDDGTWKDYITERRIKLPNHASKITFSESPKRFIVDR